MGVWGRIILVLIATFLYIGLHEIGHYVFAANLELKPQFVINGSGDRIFGGSFGVSHLSSTSTNEFLVVMGASFIPLMLVFLLLGIDMIIDNEIIRFIAAIFIILIVINLIPIPFLDELDANKLWSILFL